MKIFMLFILIIFFSLSHLLQNCSSCPCPPISWSFYFLKKNERHIKMGEWFVLPSYFWICGLLWNVVDITNVTSLKRNDFPFLRNYQLLNSSAFYIHFPPPCWNFVWLELVKTWTFCLFFFLSSFMHLLFCVWKAL